MPEIINCPDCGRQLRVPDDLLGKKVKCPGCKAMFRAEVSGGAGEEEAPPPPPKRRRPAEEEAPPPPPRRRPPAEEERYSEEPVPPRRRPALSAREEHEEDRSRGRGRDEGELYEEEYEDRPRGGGSTQGWARVKTGLTMLLSSVALILTAIIVSMLGNAIAAASSGPTVTTTTGPGGQISVQSGIGAGGGIAMAVSVCSNVLQLAAVVLKFVGYAFFLAVPARVAARNLAVATLSCAAGTIVLSIIAVAVLIFSLGAGLATLSPRALAAGGIGFFIFLVLALLSSMAETICCLLFFRKVAAFLKNNSLAQRSYYLMIMYCTMIGLGLVMGLVFFLLIGGLASSAAANPGSPPSAGTSGAFAGLGIFGCAFACVMGLGWLGWFVWYVVTLSQMHATVSARLRRA